MGKHRIPQERLDHARGLVEKNRASMKRHGAAYDRARLVSNDKAKADREWALHQRAFRLKMKWQREVMKIERELAARQVLDRRAPTRPPVATTPPHDPKAARALQRKRRQLADANVDWDPRTATGRRELYVVGLGKSMRASTSHFEACVRKMFDRTTARRLAWAQFDEHCDRVHSGELPAPKFEKGVDVSLMPGLNVNVARLDAQRRDSDLQAHLGNYLHAMLVQVIWEQQSFKDLARLGSPELLAVLLLLALDELVKFYGIPDDERAATRRSRPLHHRNGA